MPQASTTHRPWKSLLVLGLASVVAGCSLNPPPDPNNPLNVSQLDRANVLHQNIKSAADFLEQRVETGEITDAQRLALLSQKASELLADGDAQNCRPADAWIYGDLLITSGQYDKAIPVLRKAVKYAESVKDDDRRVNDSLRLARSLAETGQTEAALDEVQAVIDSKPHDPGPVLPAVLLQITPISQGKGHDEQLAKILEESIHEHLRMQVDATTVPGKMFLIARRHHITRAWLEIIRLLKNSGHASAATAAEGRARQMISTLNGTAV